MVRPTRAFKLKVSDAGFDLLVDCHMRLVRKKRTLLPYGTTLHVAVDCFARAIERHPQTSIDRRRVAELVGPSVLFVGAPRALQERAVAISRQIADRYPVEPSLEQGHVYLLALEAFIGAGPQAIDDSFRRVIALHRGEHAL